MESGSSKPQLSRTLLVIHTVLITLIVMGTVARLGWPFIYNPLESLWSDPERHFHNAFDVKGEDLESILNPPGFELFLSSLLRIIGKNREMISLVMGLLSALTPYCYFRWFREMTRDKTIALVGYCIIAWLPSYFKIFGYFMDSVILLPLTGAALWLTWRAARKKTWKSCLLAATICGAAACTKTVALPVVCLPWLYVCYQLVQSMPRARALRMTGASLALVVAIYGLGPLKVWSHTGCLVLMPDGIYNQRYFESGAHDIEVESHYKRLTEGEFVQVCIWGSSSVCYPPFHPFSKWVTKRPGRYKMVVDYSGFREYTKPIAMSWKSRLKYTWENILFFFFEYQWPEDNNWEDPFPRNADTLVRWIWLPLTVFMIVTMAVRRRFEFVPYYFLAITLVYCLQQTGVMEGRYKKLWESVCIGSVLYVVATSSRYQRWKQSQMFAASPAEGNADSLITVRTTSASEPQ